MIRILILLVPFYLHGESLKSLIDYSVSKNELISSKELSAKAKASEVKSNESNFYPIIDVGAFYQRFDESSPIMPGTTYSGYTKISYDLYSGGKKSYTLKQKRDEHKASLFESEATKKSIELAIVQDFYHIKSLKSTLKAMEEASVSVKAQLDRMKKFLSASLATSDDVDRLQSAYDASLYEIESMKFEMISLKKSLELKVGKTIDTLDESKFKKVESQDTQELDKVKALRATKSSIINASEVVDSYYYPQIRIEDTFNVYGYMDEPNIPGLPIEQLDSQNKLMATINFRLFDFSAIGEAKEAVRLNAEALNEQINYQTKEQKLQLDLAKLRISTATLNIKSSTSAKHASESAFKTISQKYKNGIVDNVVYLDAVSAKTQAIARYETSLNNLEIAYAMYYFYNGKKLGEYLNE